MLTVLAIENYRSLRHFVLPLGRLTAVTGANGSVKSNLYKALRPGEHQPQHAPPPGADPGHPPAGPVSLRLGFASEDYGYALDLGLPVPGPSPGGRAGSAFDLDPEIKRECTWAGPLALRERIRGWRFYDHFRTDPHAPARQVQIGTRTPVLGQDGGDLAAAWQTIVEVRDIERLYDVLELAFPGSPVEIDGTLRFLLLLTGLMSPRPPELMVVNEPESCLHPDLLPALARLIVPTADRTQILVVSHSALLLDASAEVAPQAGQAVTKVELTKTLARRRWWVRGTSADPRGPGPHADHPAALTIPPARTHAPREVTAQS